MSQASLLVHGIRGSMIDFVARQWSRSNADGRGKVDCDNPMVKAMLSQQLRIVLGFVQSWRGEFAGCELACTTEDGKRVIRVVGSSGRRAERCVQERDVVTCLER